MIFCGADLPGVRMPIISVFFGIVIRMYHDELMANWTHGENLEPMEMVPGADVDD
jgi:hypothetical protein